MVFRRAPNLKYDLVRAKLPRIRTEGVRGCSRCGKARCQVCSYMSEGSGFRCNVSGREYDIHSDFNCDCSGVVLFLFFSMVSQGKANRAYIKALTKEERESKS